MKIATNKDIKDFIKNDTFELHSYLTYLLLHIAK